MALCKRLSCQRSSSNIAPSNLSSTPRNSAPQRLPPQITPSILTSCTKYTPNTGANFPISTTNAANIARQNSLHLPHNPARKRHSPYITPSGLVFWQGRVKVCNALTLPNAPPHWQPLRVGLSKTNANRIATQTNLIITRTSNDLRR